MLVHEITKYFPKKGKHKPKIKNGSEAHRLYIYDNTLCSCLKNPKLIANSWWQTPHGDGIFMQFTENFVDVEWDGSKAKILEFWLPDENEFGYFHPSEIKYIGD